MVICVILIILTILNYIDIIGIQKHFAIYNLESLEYKSFNKLINHMYALSVWDLVMYPIMSDHIITTTLITLSHTKEWTWVENEINCSCVWTCLHMNKGVFRSLTCKRQTTDSSNLCILLTSDYFVVSIKYDSGKCIRLKVYILISSGVKVVCNKKTQVQIQKNQYYFVHYTGTILTAHGHSPISALCSVCIYFPITSYTALVVSFRLCDVCLCGRGQSWHQPNQINGCQLGHAGAA